jgi:hypothetical protein
MTDQLRALIQFRRGTAQEWADKDPILDSGEPGFETDTGLYKIGDGIHYWSELQYANENLTNPIILASNASFVDKTTIRSPEINFKVVGDTNIFEVPPNFMFLIDSMEIVVKIIIGQINLSQSPVVRFGNLDDPQIYHKDSIAYINSIGARHVLEIPQNAIYEGTTVTFGVSSASLGAVHTGYAVIYGSLIRVVSP